MNDLLHTLHQTQRVTTPNGETLPLHSHLPQLEGELLQTWIAQYRPQQLLEIGFAYGLSALYIVDALQTYAIPCDYYHIIDPFQRTTWQSVGISHLEHIGWTTYTLHEERSELFLPHMLAQGMIFNFAFIDGNHAFDQVMMEFFYVNRMLSIGGIIIFDDIHLFAIQKVVHYVETYPCYTILEIPRTFDTHRTVRIRRMNNVQPFRIVGFAKIAPDDRTWE